MPQPDSVDGALPIVQYWHSEERPTQIEELTATFGVNNPELPHMIFDRDEASRFIETHLSPREVAAFEACAVPSMQGDYFSYCAMLTLGGVYSDVGFLCRTPLESLMSSMDQGLLISSGERRVVLHGFFAVSGPGSPLLRLALDIATANIERRVAELVNMVTGPWVFNVLHAVHVAGSLDLPPPPSSVDLEPLAKSCRDAIGDYERVEEAFEGVRILPLEEAEWIAKPAARLAYKDSELDWVKWSERGQTIFH